jgi:lysozyme family protein
MDRNFSRALSLVLKHEGGWADHPKDPGGATMRGVTLANFRRYVKADATKADLRAITDAQLSTVYRRYYWDAVSGAELPDGVDFAVFDFAVNSGPSRAAKYMQKILGVKQDGLVGPATIAAARKMLPGTLIHRLCDERMAFLKRLKTWPTFGKGWSSRVSAVRSDALAISARPTPERPSVIEVEKEVEKPVVPTSVEKEVKTKADRTGWLVGIGGSAGTIMTGLFGANWQTVLAFGGVALVSLILIILLRGQIVSAVKEIREGLS